MADIFLSYASQDRERIRPLVRALEADGFSVWWDRNIQPGPSFDREIEQAIENSRCVLVAWSAHSVESEWVRSEVEEGARRGILIPVFIDDVLPPLAHRRRQAANLAHWDGEPDEDYEQLVAALRATLEQGESPAGPVGGVGASRPRRRRARRFAPAAMLGLAAVTLAIGVGSGFLLRPIFVDTPVSTAPSPGVIRAEIALPDGWSVVDIPPALAFSADGRRLGMLVRNGSNQRVLVRRLDALDAQFVDLDTPRAVLAGGDGAELLVEVSTRGDDARELILLDGDNSGRTPLLAYEADGRGAWIAPAGELVLGLLGEPIQRFDLAEGTSVPLTEPPPDRTHVDPMLIDDGRKLLYQEHALRGGLRGARIRVRDLVSGEDRVLMDGAQTTLTSTGHLLFTREDRLWGVAFDTRTGRPYGNEVALMDFTPPAGSSFAPYAVSAAGTLAYLRPIAADEASQEYGWLDTSGDFEPVALPVDRTIVARLSPDAASVLFVNQRDEGIFDIWRHDFERARSLRMTFEDQVDYFPTWTPDGRRMVYTVGPFSQELEWDIHVRSIDGVAAPVRLTEGAGALELTVTPDGTAVVFESCAQGEATCDLARVALDGSGDPEPVVMAEGLQQDPAISPDGRWLAYTSDESGRSEVYVRPWPNVDAARWQVSVSGGHLPVWSRSDARLFFVDPETSMLMAALYDGADGFVIEDIRDHIDLSGYEYVATRVDRNFDIDPTGERIFVPRTAEDRIVIVSNWFEELERRIPTRR